MIVNYFVENNIRTVVASGRREMARQLGITEVNLVILDLRLGQEDGLDLLREVRSRSDIPVIIVTGHRRDDIDRVVGLELGADDRSRSIFASCSHVCVRCCDGSTPDALPQSASSIGAVFDLPVGSLTVEPGG